MRICPVSESDLSSIMDIEERSFPSPWNDEVFRATMEDTRSIIRVARDQECVVGYCFALNMRSMIHVLNLAVSPTHRRQGIARKLLQAVLDEGSVRGVNMAFLEVRMGNTRARNLYHKLGFFEACTWRRYYPDNGEDACVMVKNIERQDQKTS